MQSIVNQRKNCCTPSATGEILLKKCRTNRPKKRFGLTCKAKLTFYADQKHDRFSIKAYIGQRYYNDHRQLKIHMGIKDLRVGAVNLGQSMQSAELNHSSMRNRIHQQYGVALNGDPSPTERIDVSQGVCTMYSSMSIRAPIRVVGNL